ncbi:MAG: hypothetical protein IKI64_01260 [Clostridia bacterium]|nr:hypothetical protein [Clostridia bacterium]
MANNVFERSKFLGSCKDMTGDVLLRVFFVDLEGFTWTENARNATLDNLNRAVDFLERKAAQEGVSLKFFKTTCDFSLNLYPYTYPSPLDYERAFGIELMRVYNSEYRVLGALEGFQTALLFFMNFPEGRSTANMSKPEYNVDLEYACLYPNVFFPFECIVHELMHLFGAFDFYYPDRLAKAVSEAFPRSIMLNSAIAPQIDDVTKYLIGWHDRPSLRAKQILNTVSGLSLEDIHRERIAQDNSSYTVINKAAATYYGPVVNMLPEGRGKQVMRSGTVYEGGFHMNKYLGEGTVTFPNGDVFKGYFVNDLGSGTLYRNGRAVETGTYGYQEIVFPNGDRYLGELYNMKMHGYGKLLSTDGSFYMGCFQNGQKHGRGLLRTADYRAYEGDFAFGRSSNLRSID